MFENILGQENAKQKLNNIFENRHVTNAYIFSGPEGVGKKMMAVDFANALTGDKPENRLDFTMIDVKDNETSIKISQIRALNESMNLRPQGDYKIYLINNAEKMTVQAQNALLKTLEEPLSYGIIILVTKNEQALLQTIRSRCIEIKFSPLSSIDIEKIIKKKYGDIEEIDIISAFSKGSIKIAFELMENSEFKDMRNVVEECLRHIFLEHDKFESTRIYDYLKPYSSDYENLMELFRIYIKDTVYCRDDIYSNMIVNRDRKSFIEKMAKSITLSQLGKIIEIIEDTNTKLSGNCNFNSTIQTMSINMYKVVI